MAYNVYQDDELIATTEDKEYTVTGLTPNTEYSFSVSEVIGEEESEKATATVTTKYSDVESVTVSPKTNNLKVGATRQLNATIEPSTAKQDVAWSSSDDEVVTVDSDGLVTAIAEGTATVTVTAEDVSDTATVNVTEPEEPEEPDPHIEDEIEPESIEINPKSHTFIDIWEPGTSKRFNVTIFPEDADQEYTVESSDESIIRAGIDGTQAVGKAMKSGTAELIVKTVNGLTATATITVPEQG